MKKIKKLACFALATVSAFSCLTACGPDVRDDENTLEIYIGDFGYGTEWLNEEIALFKQQQWVKDKYGENLNIPKLKMDSVKTKPIDLLTSGTTTIDLFFSTVSISDNIQAHKSKFLDLKKGVFESKADGEMLNVEDKMNESYLESCKFTINGTDTYAQIPWVDGYVGMMYNETVIKELLGNNVKMPNTSNEFLAMLEDLSDAEPDKTKFTPIAVAGLDTDYWTLYFDALWRQYDGDIAYDNYFQGKYYDEELGGLKNKDPRIATLPGRLKALEFIEACLDDKYIADTASVIKFQDAQPGFLEGAGAFMVNGDWLINEVSALADTFTDTIRVLKNPVLSCIATDKCTTIENDIELSALIDAIDAGETSFEGVSATDFETVKKARNCTTAVGGHYAFVPSYSKATGLAQDFLKFLATDQAIEKFMEVGKGFSTAYKYDIDKNSTLYQSFDEMQQDKLNIIEAGANLGPMKNYPLGYLGGLLSINQLRPLEHRFCLMKKNADGSNNDNYKTAKNVYDANVNYIASELNNMFIKAGM